MAKNTVLPLILSLFLCSGAPAQTDIVGTWQGKITIGSNEVLTIQFIIKKQADGSYAATLNSADAEGLKDIPASVVKFTQNKLAIEVASLSGSYSGTMAKGIITGEWRQAGSVFRLVLTPYNLPTAVSLRPLMGSWVGKAEADNRTVVIRFETSKNGNVVGFLDMPEQNVKDLALTEIALEGVQVAFKIPVIGAEYSGKLSGSKITGATKESKLDLIREKYIPPAPEVNVSVQDIQKLLGRWAGKINNVTIVVRFEKNEAGRLIALLDSPEQGLKDMPVLSTTLSNGRLSLKTAVMGEYNATLSGNKIDGTWEQSGRLEPLILIKESYR